jgi:DNA-binding NarL/FixJ family response regulator
MARVMASVGGLLGLDRSGVVELIALLTDRSPDQVEAAVRAVSDVHRSQHGDARPDPPLTAREREVAVLVAAGSTNAEIAARLRISKRTVEKHVDNIRQKLGAISRAKIISWTLQAERGEAVASVDEAAGAPT